MQVDPIKPTLKPPASKRLNRKQYVRLSSFGFNFNLRRSNEEPVPTPAPVATFTSRQGLTLVHFSAQLEPLEV